MSQFNLGVCLEAQHIVNDGLELVVERIFAAFEMNEFDKRISFAQGDGPHLEYELESKCVSGHTITCCITHWGLLTSVRIDGFLKLFWSHHFDRRMPHRSVREYLAERENWEKGEWQYLESYGNNDIMARGLYRLGLSSDGTIQDAQPQALSAHELLQLRLDFPLHLWPDTWERTQQ